MQRQEFMRWAGVGAVVLLAGAGCLAPREQVRLDSPEAVTRFLEQRWPIERLGEYCVDDTRGLPGSTQWPLPKYNVRWEGTLHSKATNSFAEISWAGSVDAGVLKDFNLVATKNGRDWWWVDGMEKGCPMKALGKDDVLLSRIENTLRSMIGFQADFHHEILEPGNEKTPEAQHYDCHDKLVFKYELRKEWLERERTTGRPRKYTRIVNNPSRDRLEIMLDVKGFPTEFYLNGKPDEYFTAAYREFHENYSRYLDWYYDQMAIRAGEKQGQLMDKPNWGQWNWSSSTNQTNPQK